MCELQGRGYLPRRWCVYLEGPGDGHEDSWWVCVSDSIGREKFAFVVSVEGVRLEVWGRGGGVVRSRGRRWEWCDPGLVDGVCREVRFLQLERIGGEV